MDDKFLFASPQEAGMRFTAAMQRSWCAKRPLNPSLLALSMLRDDVRRRLLDAWIDSVAERSAFIAARASALLDFITQQLPADSPEWMVCRLEQLTLHASDRAEAFEAPDVSRFDPRRVIRRSAHAGLVVFKAELNPVLAALLRLDPLSTRSDGMTAILVAPGSLPLCRAASAHQYALWTRLDRPTCVAILLQEGMPSEVIEHLLRIGALDYAG